MTISNYPGPYSNYSQNLAFKGNYLIDTGSGNSNKYSGNVSGKGEKDNGKAVTLESTSIPKSKTSKEFVANWADIVAAMIPKNDKNTLKPRSTASPENLAIVIGPLIFFGEISAVIILPIIRKVNKLISQVFSKLRKKACPNP